MKKIILLALLVGLVPMVTVIAHGCCGGSCDEMSEESETTGEDAYNMQPEEGDAD